MGCQRMFGRDRAEGHAHDGVGAVVNTYILPSPISRLAHHANRG